MQVAEEQQRSLPAGGNWSRCSLMCSSEMGQSFIIGDLFTSQASLERAEIPRAASYRHTACEVSASYCSTLNKTNTIKQSNN